MQRQMCGRRTHVDRYRACEERLEKLLSHVVESVGVLCNKRELVSLQQEHLHTVEPSHSGRHAEDVSTLVMRIKPEFFGQVISSMHFSAIEPKSSAHTDDQYTETFVLTWFCIFILIHTRTYISSSIINP